MSRQRRPPYAAELHSRIRAGWRPTGGTLHVAAGVDAWRVARQWREEPPWRGFFVAPDGERRDYSVVRGFDVVVRARDWPETAKDGLAVELVRAGASLVVVLDRGRAVAYRAAVAS